MSAHTKHRKVFHMADGSYAEVTVNIHNVDPDPAQKILDRIMAEAEQAVLSQRELALNTAKHEADARAQRVADLIRQNDPDGKVISYGSADLHNDGLLAQANEPDVPKPVSKSQAKRIAAMKEASSGKA